MKFATILSCMLFALPWSLRAMEVDTQHYDLERTGSNPNETSLTPANVVQATFGKHFTVSMNANVNGQALYVPGLSIAGTTHDVLFAYTSNNVDGSPCGIYAFDADSGGTPLWSRSLTSAARYTTNTPVIDPAAKIMYFVSKDTNNEGANWLHAVDLATGSEKAGSPVEIGGSVPGTGDGTSGGLITFPATHANCRPGLLLVNGIIYLGFSFNSDARPYHGWIISYAYNGTAFTRTGIFCVSPNKEAGGIWQAGKGLVSDGTSIFCATGNGSFDNALATGSAFGMCFLKLNASLQVEDYFAEASESSDSNADRDLGNCGPVFIPGTQVLFAGGTKYGRGHLVDATNMGHFSSSSDACLQTISAGLSSSVGQNPVAWNGGSAGTFVYVWSSGQGIAQYQYDAATKKFTNGGSPIHVGSATNGGSLCVTSNGTANGVLWAVGNDATVHAYNAANVTSELWNSNQDSARDALPSVGHFQFPMVADGKLFVPTNAGTLVAYGLIATQVPAKLAIIQQPGTSTAAAPISPAIRVAIQDASGALVTGATATISLAIGSNPAAGTLSGTTTQAASAGIATFPSVAINAAGSGYTLIASSSGLASATTTPFSVLAQVAKPVIAPSGGSFSGPVTVRLTDATAGSTITYAIGSGPATAYSAPFVLSASGALSVTASKSGLTTSAAATASFTVTGSTAYGLPLRDAVTGIVLPPNLSTAPPATLSATGVFSNASTLTPRDGIIPYAVNTPLWSDSAYKQRWIALPGSAQIAFQSTGEWSFPGGTLLIKHFELGVNDTDSTVRKRLETRLLFVTAASPNNGYGITYKWRDDNSDADLVTSAGLDEVITITTATGTRTQTWHYPSQGECLTCHTSNAGFVLGPKTRQINGAFTYPSTNITDNQLRTWNYLEMFTTVLPEGSIPGLSHMAAITDASATLEDRVKSYVDANCSQCHRPGGVATAWDARYDVPMASQGIIDGAIKTTLGIAGAEMVVPQDISRSMLPIRMHATDSTKMPPLARNLVDTGAVSVVDQWINGLPLSTPGFMATYFNSINLTGTSISRVDPSIDFDWGTGSPDPAIAVDNFSARWTGQILAQHSETYTFYTTTDDGVRLWIDGQLLIDKWVDQSSTTWTAALPLTAGQRYNVTMEYYEHTGFALAKLEWSSPSTARAVIPSSAAIAIEGFTADINFQPASAPDFGNGYLIDSSQPYGDRGNGFTYGWNATFNETRYRGNPGSPDLRYDTFNHMQKPSNPNAVWEIAVPNGNYEVRIVSGDPDNIDSVFKINVEGVLIVNGIPSASPFLAHWVDSGYRDVTVADGRLTVSNAPGSSNNKICFIEIAQLPASIGMRGGHALPPSTFPALPVPRRDVAHGASPAP
jgi:uncharacterized repeat protein (TIGR03806 family)